MLSVRTNLIIALAIGALISTTLLVLEPLTDFAFLWLEWPGISAAYLFWGATGGSVVAGVAISWVVNALTYGLGAFAILSVLSALVRAGAPRALRP
ncbi:hypothetical protein JQ543_19775 [Bradyrhizobium diazoefficiens]|nr:hypothetical protein [Bradyrhizobium diazoefficiens]MBR0850001.1 hypothetical protein [Bradyrhizobium diazoefficiens]